MEIIHEKGLVQLHGGATFRTLRDDLGDAESPRIGDSQRFGVARQTLDALPTGSALQERKDLGEHRAKHLVQLQLFVAVGERECRFVLEKLTTQSARMLLTITDSARRPQIANRAGKNDQQPALRNVIVD